MDLALLEVDARRREIFSSTSRENSPVHHNAEMPLDFSELDSVCSLDSPVGDNLIAEFYDTRTTGVDILSNGQSWNLEDHHDHEEAQNGTVEGANGHSAAELNLAARGNAICIVDTVRPDVTELPTGNHGSESRTQSSPGKHLSTTSICPPTDCYEVRPQFAPAARHACLKHLHNDVSSSATVGSKRGAQWTEEDDATGEFGKQSELQPVKKQAKQGQTVDERGVCTKNNPAMQQQAREGQKHWHEKVGEMRTQWYARGMWGNAQFLAQVNMCKLENVKSQHECLLLQLQMASTVGLIRAHPFSTSEKDSFLGWTGFEVVAEQGAAFRRTIEEMFAHSPNSNTLNNTMRRAGLFPTSKGWQGWEEAWTGASSCRRGAHSWFKFDAKKRAQYTSKKEA